MKISSMTRVGTLEDAPALMVLLKKFFDQSPFSEFQYDEKKVRRLLEAALIDPRRAIVIVSVDPENKPIGLIVGLLEEALFSTDKVVVEKAWYVEPEYRKGKRAFELLDALEAWSEAVGALYVYYGVLREGDEEPSGPIERTYRHRGCRPAEAGYMKKLRK